jgi:uncharacterized protein YybS (DUF2232 family)
MRGLVMNLGVKAILSAIFITVILNSLLQSTAIAQIVAEPPVPVYFMHQKDNVKAAYEDSLSAQRQALADANKQIDSLRLNLQKLSTENSTRFTWLYTLIALLVTSVIGLLLLITYIKKEQTQTKRVERR